MRKLDNLIKMTTPEIRVNKCKNMIKLTRLWFKNDISHTSEAVKAIHWQGCDILRRNAVFFFVFSRFRGESSFWSGFPRNSSELANCCAGTVPLSSGVHLYASVWDRGPPLFGLSLSLHLPIRSFYKLCRVSRCASGSTPRLFCH